MIQVIGSYSTKNVPTEYDEQITKLQGEMLNLIEENAKKGSITEDFDGQYQRITEQIRELKQKSWITSRNKNGPQIFNNGSATRIPA